MSTYVPSWVKRDQQRFPRVQRRGRLGRRDSLRVFGRDARCRRARVRGIHGALAQSRRRTEHRAHDPGGERDRHAADRARARFRGRSRVRATRAAELMRALAAQGTRLEPELRASLARERIARTSGSWAAGVRRATSRGQEVFTAWHYARFAEALVKAGKAKYDLPMFVNAALNRTGRKPGEYPSGGPLPHLLDVWKAGAPSLDFLAPDIYFPNFSQLAARFNRAGQRVVHSRGEQRDESSGSGERVLLVRRARRVWFLAVLDRVAARCAECVVADV